MGLPKNYSDEESDEEEEACEKNRKLRGGGGLGASFKGNKYKIDQIRGNKKDLLLDFERDG